MKNSIYSINKGINRSIEFKGLKAQYIWYLLIGVILLLLLFSILYLLGLSSYLCLFIIIPLLVLLLFKTYQWSSRYGEHGMMKTLAKAKTPGALLSQNRKVFLKPLDHELKF